MKVKKARDVEIAAKVKRALLKKVLKFTVLRGGLFSAIVSASVKMLSMSVLSIRFSLNSSESG